MEIVKKLILNKTPKDMPYGSISCAKNMMVDDTGSFLTNDIGFKEVFNTFMEQDSGPDDYISYSEEIVGVIPCDRELIIFTKDSDNICHIYRKPDGVSINYNNKEDYRTNAVWQWHGGKITGTYTYNYKGELIIAFGEYDCPNNIKVPLKSLNLDTTDNNQTYNVEEDIPEYDSSYVVNTNGSLVCGVYTFFIRFNIDDHNYTKWFQITGDINIIQEAQSKKYSHQYLKPGAANSSTLADEINLPPVEVNSNGISNKGITVNITFGNTTFNKFQLGYIIKRNSDISGRLQGEYIVENVEQHVSIVNNSFIDEVSVDKFLENPHQFFNVKNVVNYNNRLYISNYEEYPIEDLSEFASQSNIDVTVQEESNTNPNLAPSANSNKVWNITFNLIQREEARPNAHNRYNKGVIRVEVTTDANGKIIGDGKTNLINAITQYLAIIERNFYDILWNSEHNINLFWFIQDANGTFIDSAICLNRKVSNSSDLKYSEWIWNFNVPEYDLIITGTNETDLDIIVSYENSNNVVKTWSLLGKNGERLCILGYVSNTQIYFGNGVRYLSDDPALVNTRMPNDILVSINPSGTYYRNETVPGDDDSDAEESGGYDEGVGINTRTLHPYQKYNFFIHYIRKDGSCTLGFPIGGGFKSYKLDDGNTVIVPTFKDVTQPNNNYIGFFISYEDVESTVDCVYITGQEVVGTDKKIAFTNAKYLFDIDNIRGNDIFIDNNKKTLSGIKYIENRLTYNHVEGTLVGDTANLNITDDVAFYTKDIASLYNNKAKVLYRLTKNVYDWENGVTDADYLPAFYNTQIIVTYKDENNVNSLAKEVIIDPASSFVTGFEFGTNKDSRTTYEASINTRNMYSNYPTQAMSIKEDFQQAAVTLDYLDNGNSVNRLHINTLISPDRLHDWLELKEAYRAKPSKRFTNFNADNTYIFDKTVYRSNVISDESLENRFRIFEPNSYKNIFENKGKIVNIVGIGLYLIVHTEQSIFVFDRTPKLTNRSQLDIPDVFDIDYQDLMPSNEGFGGLYEKEEAILTKNGYVWFDRVNKMIFNFENGKINIISSDINNFIKQLDIIKVRFAEDIIYNRLIVCIYVNVNNITETVTLSYSFNTNSFISLHDYKFTHNFRTSQKSYVLDTDNREVLYEFDDTAIVNYEGLHTSYNTFFPYYNILLGETVTAKSYIDVIFNRDYFIVKVVNSIRYLLNVIEDAVNIYNITEEHLDRRFSGDALRIYSDETDSGDLNINVEAENINMLNGYKYPYFEKGYWNLNYFRNKILSAITDDEVKKSLGKDTIINPVNKQMARSDNRSLIYGKYIVVRFIFGNDKKVKLDGVDIRTNEY